MRKYVNLAMLLAISIVLSIVESFIPTIVVGAKLGLANIVILLAIYMYGIKESLLLLVLRILIVSLLLGNFLSIPFYMSVAGGLCALGMMILLKFFHFHIICVSLSGALCHGIGQIFIAVIIIAPEALYYYPLMALTSLFTGFITGFIARQFLNIRKKANDEENETGLTI